jgi:hypothetical protein
MITQLKVRIAFSIYRSGRADGILWDRWKHSAILCPFGISSLQDFRNFEKRKNSLFFSGHIRGDITDEKVFFPSGQTKKRVVTTRFTSPGLVICYVFPL